MLNPADHPQTHHLSSRRVLLPLGMAVCLSLFGDLSLYAVLAGQADMVGLSLAAVGVMLGANRLIRIPLNPLAGAFFDRFGRRRLFLLGMTIGTTSVAGFGIARGFWPFLLTRLGWGIAWTLINVGGMTMVLDITTPTDRGRLAGIYNIFMLLGLALGPLVGGALVDTLGFQPAMFICAGLGLLGLLVVAFALPETGRPEGSGSASGTTQPHVHSSPQEWVRRVRYGILGNRQLRTTFGLYLITQLAGEGIVLSTVNLLLQQRFGQVVSLGTLSLGVATVSGLILSLRSLLAGVTGPVAGHLSDAGAGRRPIIVTSLVLGTAGFALLAFANTLPAIVLGVVLSAVSGGAALVSLAAQIGDQTRPGQEGITMGAYATAGDIGSTAGPFLAFTLVSLTGLRWVYLICSLAFVGGLVLTLRQRPTARRPNP
ncbi:MAG: MFS transporter [Anaerolineae bacterium]|nr:MFS transporter [Anaerolineae bacterium]